MKMELLMSKVIVFTNLTLDGVMQAPGRPDEDRRGGFEHGGWAVPYAAMTQAGDSIATIGALLLGRRTYQDFSAVWPKRKEDPLSAMLDAMQKYAASTTLSEIPTRKQEHFTTQLPFGQKRCQKRELRPDWWVSPEKREQ
jgi:dihydrofolate reductase